MFLGFLINVVVGILLSMMNGRTDRLLYVIRLYFKWIRITGII